MTKYRRDWPSLRHKIEACLERQPDGCWVWPYAKCDGYGAVSWEGRRFRVHRAYLLALGYEYPEGWVTDHLCRNRACANPDHLEIVTPQENVLRGASTKYQVPEAQPVSMFGVHNSDKTHCIHGHEFTPENTSFRPTGGRYCRACWRISSKRRYDKRHAKGESVDAG